MSKKLLNLLYQATSREVAPKVPMVKAHLFANDEAQLPTKSALDDLMENQWNQKPALEALEHPWVRKNKPSNILHIPCPSSCLTEEDFVDIFPINRERQYRVPHNTKKGLDVKMIKSRHPLTLNFENSYYLVFKNAIEASLYALETHNKALNGFRLKPSFVEPSIHAAKYWVSPWFLEKSPSPLKIKNDIFQLPTPKVPISVITRKDDHYRNLLNQLETTTQKVDSDQIHPNFDIINTLTHTDRRSRSVIVRNWPFGILPSTTNRLLWDYDVESMSPILSDITKNLSVHLITFTNPTMAKRFVRNYHGKKWDPIQWGHKEKPLHEPIQAEIAN
ncbi:hypothetical protein DIURU_001117 [Diutina rugosa]|uniref:Uncharacterized protein n=1 Tax=Diutina rugosa TaxID=5481 RepID=A0A642UVQ9_DIURU|nr:uncharacterized protein DIURU_001117 [Diutina rugosa]KAA8906379.1 hypothetical protein DIURU_001117 [Diutina rugosa]